MMSGLHFIEPAAASFVAVLLNCLWQGVGLFALAWLFLRTFRVMNATTRYVMWLVALLSLVILPLSSGWFPSPEQADREEDIPRREEIPLRSLSSGLVVLEGPRDTYDGKAESLEYGGELSAKPAVIDDYGVFSIGSSRVASWNLAIRIKPGRWTLLAALGWILTASLMLGRVTWSYLHLRRLKRTSFPVGERFLSRLGEWRKVSGSGRAVELRCSDQISGPVAAGLSRPVILLPCHLIEKLNVEELDQVGLHEMAHLSRRDDWTNFLQKLVEAIFFFHPAVHWIGRQLDIEREIACDDWVIFRTGKPKPYAACLTRLVELTGHMDVPALAPGSWTTKKQITRRIEMSLNRSRNFTPRLSKASLLVSAIVLVFVAIQFAMSSPLVTAAEQGEKPPEKVLPGEETALQDEPEAPPEVIEEPVPVPIERPLTLEQEAAPEKAVAQERQQRLRELAERERQEREAMRIEAERRTMADSIRVEREIEQARRRYEAGTRLYELDQEQGIIYSRPVLVGIDEEPAIPEDELIELMSEIVRNDSDSMVRAAALESIGRLGSEAASEALVDLYDAIPELELKKKSLSSMSFSRKITPKVRAKLIDIAKTSPNDDLRMAALRALAGVAEEDGANALISVYDSAQKAEIKKTIIRYLGFNRSETAIEKLKAIARNDSDAGLRLEAVQSLGQLHRRGHVEIPRGELLFADEVPILAAPAPELPPEPPRLPEIKN